MSPAKPRTMILSIAVVVLVVLIIAVVVLLATNRTAPTAAPSSSPPSSATAPTAPSTPALTPSSAPPSSQRPAQPSGQPVFTKYFINTEAEGVVYATGIKIQGDQVSGWAGALRASDITCFNGRVSGGRLSGTLWSHPDEGGGPLVSQRFSWRVSGKGDQLALLEVSSISPLTEVPVGTVNQDAAQPADSDWQSTFDQCAKLTGGLK